MNGAAEIGARTDGRHNATAHGILVELVELVASGAVRLPISATYPLGRVADAFAELEQRHTRAKIVLISSPEPRADRGGRHLRRTLTAAGSPRRIACDGSPRHGGTLTCRERLVDLSGKCL
ncbi:hypothetical protein GCM10010306_095900 [Streptomyces umbrinus]|uniref:zinc-binding dehydrogenase n=1 Tax=Streptomyces umbrinus TaxID=67370 RepID=UPI0016741C35|nr:hypothetical protein GCM10010306_095900 [Streptomyces umbrinus]